MIHYDSSGKLTKSVSKQLFKWDAPAPSCIHRQINTFMCSYLRFLFPANELLTLQLTTLRHRWNNPPPSSSRAWSNLRWTVWAPPCAAGSQLWLSADGHHTFDRCIGSASSTRTNDKRCKKKMMHAVGLGYHMKEKKSPWGWEKEIMFIFRDHSRVYDSSPWTWNEKSAAARPSVLWHIRQATDH